MVMWESDVMPLSITLSSFWPFWMVASPDWKMEFVGRGMFGVVGKSCHDPLVYSFRV